MRVRCSQVGLMLGTFSSVLYALPLISVPTCHQGLQVQDYFGNFCKRVPTDIDLPAVSKSNWFKIKFHTFDFLFHHSIFLRCSCGAD